MTENDGENGEDVVEENWHTSSNWASSWSASRKACSTEAVFSFNCRRKASSSSLKEVISTCAEFRFSSRIDVRALGESVRLKKQVRSDNDASELDILGLLDEFGAYDT